LAAGSLFGPAKLWSVLTARRLLTLPGFGFASLAFSPDGKTLASGHGEGKIILWNVTTGQELLTLQGDPGGPTCVVFPPGGKTLMTAGLNGTVEFWGEAPPGLASRVKAADLLAQARTAARDLELDTALARFAAAFAVAQPDDLQPWLDFATVLACRTDPYPYHKHCAEMRKRFGKDASPSEQIWLALSSALKPDAGTDWGALFLLTEVRPGSAPKVDRALQLQAQALIEHRAGRFAVAQEKAQRALEAAQSQQTSTELPHVLLALAHQNQGRSADAERHLEKVKNQFEGGVLLLGLEKAFEKGQLRFEAAGIHGEALWRHQLRCAVLMAEAGWQPPSKKGK
jgi:hypothetical protein